MSVARRVAHIGALGLLLYAAPLGSTVRASEGAGRGHSLPRVARRITQPRLAFGNPFGLAFSPRSRSFVIAPVEGPAFVQLLSDTADPAGVESLDFAGADALNMAFDGVRGRLLVISGKQMLSLAVDTDGRFSRKAAARFDITHLGIQIAAGLSVDPDTGALYVLDSAIPRLVRVEPTSDGGLEAAVVSYRDLYGIPADGLRGLAYDRVSGHLFLLGGRRTLYETSVTGELIRTHDVSGAKLKSPGAIVFAPTGDQTDDAAAQSLYVADAGTSKTAGTTGGIVELTFAPLAAAQAPTNFTSSVVHTVLTSQWNPPAPDTSDVVYLPASNTLLVVDSEVEEMRIWAGANQWETTLSGTVIDTTDLTPPSPGFTVEPTGISVNPANRHLFYSDDTGSPRKVWEVAPGPDGKYHTADDVRTWFSTSAFGSTDPEDVTYHPGENVLYLADGVNAEVYRIAPGANGRFDGIPPAGDDVLTHFDVSQIVTDPECLAVDTDNGHLYIGGNNDDVIQEISTSGTLLQTINIAAANALHIGGVGFGPGSTDPNARRLYLVQRGVDNNSNSSENDGKLWELTLPGSANGNFAPSVDAGTDITITLPASASLNGTVSDDGRPNPPALVTTSWSKVSGPGSVSFGNAAAVDTTASFSTSGSYVLRLTANDSELTSSDDVAITVLPEGTVEVRITLGADDAEERVNKSVSLTDADLDLVNNNEGGVTGDGMVGLRFRSIGVSPGSTITNAWVQFQADETTSGSINLTIRGEAADNAAAFVQSTGNLSNRVKTTASASWAPGSWTIGNAGAAQRTGNIAAVLQQIVDRPGWNAGNALVLFVNGTGKRVAESYEGLSAAAALLHIEQISGPPVNHAPVVNAGPDQTVTFGSAASLDGTVSDDGLPSGSVTTTWSQVSGPGTASFTDASAVDTTATFTAAGSYVLRLTADDGALTASDDVTVTADAGGGSGTLSVVKRSTIHSATDASSYVFPSFAASNGRLYIAFLNSAVGSGSTAPAATSVSGAGLSFTEIGTPGGLLYSSSPGMRRLQAFRALASSGATTGSITVTLGGTSIGLEGVLLEFSGVDASGTNGAGAIAQSVAGSTLNATSLTLSMGSFSSSANRPVAFFSHREAETLTPEAGYTVLDNASHTGPLVGTLCEWNSATADTEPSASWLATVDAAVFALEIKPSP